MIICSLTEPQARALRQNLRALEQPEPLTASYNVPLNVNNDTYIVKLQPERHNKFAVLQALRVPRDQAGQDCALITHGGLLAALWEILLDQGLAGEKPQTPLTRPATSCNSAPRSGNPRSC